MTDIGNSVIMHRLSGYHVYVPWTPSCTLQAPSVLADFVQFTCCFV